MQGVFTPADRDDISQVVAIGKETFAAGDLNEQSGAIVIGRGDLKKAPRAKGSVVIGIDNMMDSTATNCDFNTIIGRNACQYMVGAACSNNIVIGNQAMRDPGSTAGVNNSVVISSNACCGPHIANNVVCIGERAGYRKSSSLGAIGSHAVIIGLSTCDMGNTDNSVGTYSICLGTASSSSVPSDSMMLGRGAQVASANSGHIVIGSNLHYCTMVCAVADDMTFQTGVGTTTQSLSLSPASCNMISSGSTKLTCGTKTLELSQTACTLGDAIPFVLPSRIIIDSNGYSLFAPGVRISGDLRLNTATPEVRCVLLNPVSALVDSSTSQVVHTITSPHNNPPNDLDDETWLVDGVRTSSVNNEMFYFINPHSFGFGDGDWKVMSYRVNMGTKGPTGSPTASPSEKNLCTVFLARQARQVGPTGNLGSTTITDYLAEYADVSTGTNTLVSLSNPRTPAGAKEYAFIWCATTNSNQVTVSAYIYIMRM